MKKIKTSSAIIAGLLLFLILLILSGIIYMRVLAGRSSSPEESFAGQNLQLNGDGSSMTFPLEATTNEIAMSGIWESEIIRSETAELTIICPDWIDPAKIQWDMGEKKLTLRNTVKRPGDRQVPKAIIAIPDLTALQIADFTNLTFSGFQKGEELQIHSSGMVKLEGAESSFKKAHIILSGAGSIDLSRVYTDNAEIYLSGAGSIQLHMNGGILEGQLSGLGKIEYTGSIIRNGISTSGLGSVTKQN